MLNITPKTRSVGAQPPSTPAFHVFTARNIDQIPQLAALSDADRFAIRVAASVFPFRVNQYLIDQLIDWDRVPDDPIFRLVFPQPEMLSAADFHSVAELLRSGANAERIRAAVDKIRWSLNPHPAMQWELNVPRSGGQSLFGMQHKYRETVLFFPAQGQTCHSYCTFCFRWAQFVGIKELRFASREVIPLKDYLREHQGVTDVLFTGGDPLVMRTSNLAAYIEPLLQDPSLDHVRTLRIGTKALTYWPYRFLHDPDADALLRLFEQVVRSGKQLAIMAHINHWRELETPAAREAIRRVRDTGAIIRSQAPVLQHINADADVWARLWRTQADLGIIPHYMFLERDTGARDYFQIPLAHAVEIYRNAIQQVSGLARTARGPSMSAGPGKVEVQGVARIGGEDVFVLRFLQGRRADWVHRPFFARFDASASWLDQLKPAFGEHRFFFQDDYDAMVDHHVRDRNAQVPTS